MAIPAWRVPEPGAEVGATSRAKRDGRSRCAAILLATTVVLGCASPVRVSERVTVPMTATPVGPHSFYVLGQTG